MSDLLRKGSQWLEQMREKHCSSPVRYERDGETVQVNATYGKTDYQLASDAGINVGSHVWDFLILSDALPFEPEPGDIIEADGIRFEVMPLGDDINGWRWSDPYRATYRIHTREIGRA